VLGHWAHGQLREGGSDTTLASGTAKPQPPEKNIRHTGYVSPPERPQNHHTKPRQDSKVQEVHPSSQCKPEGSLSHKVILIMLKNKYTTSMISFFKKKL